MIHKSRMFTECPLATYSVRPETWLEEIFAIGKLIAEAMTESNSTAFISKNLPAQIVSILFFAAAQLDQFDIIQPILDKIVQNLECVDIIIPYFIRMKNHLAVSLLLDTYSSRMSINTKLCACLFLAKIAEFAHKVDRYLDELEPEYPVHVLSMRLSTIIKSNRPSVIYDRAEELLALVKTGLEKHPKNHQMLYNAAYVEAILSNKSKALELCKESIRQNPCDHRSVLLLLKLLRKYSQPAMVHTVTKKAKHYFVGKHKLIYIENLWAKAELNKQMDVRRYVKKLRLNWPNDNAVMGHIMRVCLSLNSDAIASLLQEWTEWDDHTPEFYFCLAQLCVRRDDMKAAQKNLITAIELDPCNAEYRASLACVYARMGDLSRAREQAKFAVQFNPFLDLAWIAMSCTTDGEESASAKAKYFELRDSVVPMSELDLMLFVQAE